VFYCVLQEVALVVGTVPVPVFAFSVMIRHKILPKIY